MSQSAKQMAQVLPKDAEWLRTRAVAFDPDANTVTTEDGTTVEYEYAVLAMGIQEHILLVVRIQWLKNNLSTLST